MNNKIFKLVICSFLLIFFIYIPFTYAAPATQPLRVILDWFVNPDHAPLFVAKEQGYYHKFGVKVEFIAPADPSDGVKLVAAGKADIALTYEPQYLLQVHRGLPLAEIGVLIATPLDALMVMQNGPIHSVADLKGKRVGYSAGSASHVALQTMLSKSHLTLNDIKLVNVHYGLSKSLLTGKVDAVTSIMRNFEPLEVQLVGRQVRVFYVEENGMPLYNELILVTNQRQKNDPRIKRFLQALQWGTIYLLNHPKQCWQTFAKNHPELKNKLNKQVWFATLPRFALRPALIDKAQQQKLKEFLQAREFFGD